MIITLRPRQHGRHFADDVFECICLNENVWISIKISLKFFPKDPINNNPALVQIMAWRRPGDKPLSKPMMVNLLAHLCVTRPQWVIRAMRQSSWCCDTLLSPSLGALHIQREHLKFKHTYLMDWKSRLWKGSIFEERLHVMGKSLRWHQYNQPQLCKSYLQKTWYVAPLFWYHQH